MTEDDLKGKICDTMAPLITTDLAIMHRNMGLDPKDMAYTLSLVVIATLSALITNDEDGKKWLDQCLSIIREATVEQCSFLHDRMEKKNDQETKSQHSCH